MTKLICVYAVAMFLIAACSSSAQQAGRADPQQTPKASNVNPDAGLVADFKKRVDEYVKLREKAVAADSCRPPGKVKTL